MKTIEMAKATGSLSEYAREAQKGTLVVTSHGRPVAAVVPLEDSDMESLSIGTNPKFLAIIENARARYRAEGGISLAEMRRKYGKKR